MSAWALLIAASLAASASAAPAAVPSAAPAGAIAGRAVDAVSGEPVEAATVVLEPGRRVGATGADGRFLLSGLPPGSYRVEVSHVAYRSSGPIEVALAPGVTADLKIRLERSPVRETVVVRPLFPPPGEGTQAVRLSSDDVSGVPGTLGDLARALTAVPGVASINDLKGDVRIHGGDPGDTLFRMDGVTVSSPYHFRFTRASVTGINLAAFDAFAVRSSSLAASVGDTVSGVIELEPSERGARGGFLEAALGSLSASATGGGPIAQGSWIVAGRYSSLALYRNFYDVEQRSVPIFQDLLFRARTRIGPRASLVAGSLLLGSDVSTSDPEDGSSTEMAAKSRIAYAGLDAEVAGHLRLSGRISWEGSRQAVRSTDGDDLVARDGRFGLSLEIAEGDPARLAWRAGLEEALIEGNYFGAIQTAGVIAPLAARSTRTGAHAAVTLEPAAGWSVDAGVRIDRDSRRGVGPVEPRIALTHVGTEGRKAWLAASRYAQFPRFEQEFLAQGLPLETTVADEVSAGVALGLGRGIQLDATVFARRLGDLTAETINQFPDLPEPMARFERGYGRGLDVSVREDQGRFRSRLAVSLLRSRETRGGVESPVNGDQPYKVDLSGGWRFAPRWELSGRVQASSGLPYSTYVPAGDGGRALGALNGGRLPSYARLDARVSWDISPFKGRGRFYLEIVNLLAKPNVRARELRYDPEESRYYFHDTTGMPRIPAFGLEIAWGN